MPKGKQQKAPQNALVGCCLSGAAASTASLFTNPFNVVKVRLQKAGRGRAKQQSIVGLVSSIVRQEGVLCFWSGIQPAMVREFSKNFPRFGLYEPLLGVLHKDKNTSPPFMARLSTSMTTGALGAFLCQPFELIMSRAQSSSAGANSSGVMSLIRQQGVLALYSAVHVNVARSMVGTPAILVTKTYSSDYLASVLGGPDRFVNLVSAFLGSIACQVVMQPIDMMRTRLYLQPRDSSGRGLEYEGLVDCFQKISRTEGPFTFTRGFTPAFMRLAPHLVLTQCFLFEFQQGWKKAQEFRDLSGRPQVLLARPTLG